MRSRCFDKLNIGQFFRASKITRPDILVNITFVKKIVADLSFLYNPYEDRNLY